jgi:hypothetical protein
LAGPSGLTPRGAAVLGSQIATARQIDLFLIDVKGAVNIMWVADACPRQGPLVI